MFFSWRRRRRRPTSARVVCLGLDDAGKTQLLRKLSRNKVMMAPTHGFNIDTFSIDGVKLTLWDIGGGPQIRPMWRKYLDHTDALVYVVDSSKESRWKESKEALAEILQDPRLKKVPLLVFNNKVDLLPAALPNFRIETEIRPLIKGGRNFGVFASSGRTDFPPVDDGFDWLISKL